MSQLIQLGLLGNGLGRSRAKNLHELLGNLYGLNIDYRVMDLANKTPPISISRELERCREEGFRGVNVTHPYKCEAFPFVTPLDSFPPGLTSVNTVLFQAGAMPADNTDYSGFYAAFRNQFGEECRPGKVLMLGAGGVGVAIAFALNALGVEDLVIYDTSLDTAQNLVWLLAKNNLQGRLANQELTDEMQHSDGLVNATPVGMFQYPGNPFPLAGFGSQQWAFDAVYTPENTQFLQECRKLQIDTLSGFQLFLYQGLHAFERFTGISPDPYQTEAEFLKKHPLA